MKKKYSFFLIDFQTSLQQVTEICTDIRTLCQELQMEEADCFAIELLSREALNNAVLHSCSRDQQQKVTSTLYIKPQEVIIEVKDPGEGFDWQSMISLVIASNTNESTQEECGRGLYIYKSYASSIKFNRVGNSVRLYRSMKKRISI